MKTEGENCLGPCPVEKVADLIGDCTSMLIIRDLLTGPKRFGEITMSSGGASTRTVTAKLKHLEACGIVLRQSFCEKPPRVEYSLTEKGKGLKAVIDSMRTFAERHLAEV
ncbi:MAG TPA: helix-turn-helix domain-containing protein [Candidatus Paceibacterota bacterium]